MMGGSIGGSQIFSQNINEYYDPAETTTANSMSIAGNTNRRSIMSKNFTKDQ